MFSSILLRIYSARKYNPQLFKHITLIIDGHDSRINYVNTDIKKEKLYSYKFKNKGIRTQIISDINDMVLFISRSKYCGESSDGSMFLNFKLYNKINTNDVIAMDGGYTLFVNKFIELSRLKNKEFNNHNFVFPIRKDNKIKLTEPEKHFNNVFGSFRSKIENQFSEIGNKFNRFNNNSSVVRMDNIKFYNLQFKIACLLKNIKKFTELYNIPILPHHKLWEAENFEFPSEAKLIDIVITNEEVNKEKLNNMIKLQDNFIKVNLNNNINITSDYDDDIDIENNTNQVSSEDDVPKFNEKKRKRKNKSKAKNIKTYEVEKILNHKIEDNKYIFLVKWKYYDNDNNSWIPYTNFEQKDIINKYLEQHNINYK